MRKTEQSIRKLRDIVFERKISDEGWKAVRDNWLTQPNIEWLKNQAKKMHTKQQ